ncbi:MAG: 50S ribosomal protein L30e [Candidatus Diapherotrites archaeon]|nr:50S ribosomal protein L30e [Candidatus Diapherotrites archaeon]
MDIGFQLKRAMETGDVKLGFRSVEKSLLNGRSKLIIMAERVPERIKMRITHLAKVANVPVYVFKGGSLDLGELAGRPHFVAVISIDDPGDSSILELAKEVTS